jgi:excisionase family DNA binding protein
VDDPLLTVREVAEALRVSEKTIRSWIKERRILHASKVTRRAGWRIPRSEVERLASDSPEQ